VSDAPNPAALLSRDNVRLGAGVGRMLSLFLLVAGGLLIALTGLGALLGDSKQAALAIAAHHVGFVVCVGLTLGSMAMVMILHQVNAGWAATIRRIFEQTMSMAPFCILLFLPSLVFAGSLFHWMDPEYTQGDVLYAAKAPYLNRPFFVIRAVIYFAAWVWLGVTLHRQSIQQDEDGDRWHTAKARRRSSYGLIILALTTAFASFDWLMSLDYHWFSTMFGVYFFAGYIGAALAFTTLALLVLRRMGALKGLVTEEHFHDLGKLLFGFTVFWAYIGFSQYFLIWYANIPEETGWFMARRTDGWMPYSMALAVGRFFVPFVVLMARPARRNPIVLALITVWILAFHVIDTYWVVRPTVKGVEATFTWLDAVGVLGPILVFLGLLIWKIASAPLVPVNDPRMNEAMRHKNYV